MSSLDQSAAKFVCKIQIKCLRHVISTRHLHGERFLDHDCHVRHLARPLARPMLDLSNIIHTRKNIQSKLSICILVITKISRPTHINPGPPTLSVSNTGTNIQSLFVNFHRRFNKMN